MSRVNTHRKSKLVLSAAVALTTFALGFGSMFLWWLRLGSLGLRGFFDYRSATVGDALILPVITGLMTVIVSKLTPTKRDRTWAISGGLVGAVATVVLQAVWLADPHPQPNWTFPAAHQFNIAGWWHAGFMLLLSIFLGACAALTLARWHGTSRANRPNALVGAVLALTALFFGLVASDSASSGHRLSIDSTLVAGSLVTIVVAGFALSALVRRARS